MAFIQTTTVESEVDSLSGSVSSLQSDVSTAQLDISDLQTNKFDKSGGLISGSVSISGDLSVSGTQFIVNTESVSASDNLIVINAGETGVGVTAGEAGIEVDRGDEPNYHFKLVEGTEPLFKIGEVGDYQAVATREDNPGANSGNVAIWDDTNKQFVTTGNGIINGVFTVSDTGSSTRQYVRVRNAGSDVYFGCEGSTAEGFFTGSNAYDATVWAGNNRLLLYGEGIVLNSETQGVTTDSDITVGGRITLSASNGLQGLVGYNVSVPDNYIEWYQGTTAYGYISASSTYSDFRMVSYGNRDITLDVGTGNINFSGNVVATEHITLNNSKILYGKDTGGTNYTLIHVDSGNVVKVSTNDLDTQIRGTYIDIRGPISVKPDNSNTAFVVESDNDIKFPLLGTTSSTANAYLNNSNSNLLVRSTSSRRYKTDIEYTVPYNLLDTVI
jgi:hypothetical protein